MKKLTSIFVTFFILMAGMTLSAQTPDGRQIMQMADDRDDGQTETSFTTMMLTSKNGRQRKREIVSYRKDYGDVEKTVMVFLEPKDVEGVGYLTYGYEEIGKDDDTWLYLPALKKVRRISGSSRNDYFMGTDFTYDDMGDREVDEDTHVLKGEEAVDGKDCWIVESVPREDGYMYSRRVTWIRKDLNMAVKVDYYDRQGKLLKQLVISDITRIDGIWTALKMKMVNVQDKHETLLVQRDAHFNLEIDDSSFRVSSLERGRVR